MNEHVKDICKVGQGRKCCRYLLAGAEGFECAKLTEIKPVIDKKVRAGTFTSRGRGCLGINNDKSKTILNQKQPKG
jgi:hypothetical protein